MWILKAEVGAHADTYEFGILQHVQILLGGSRAGGGSASKIALEGYNTFGFLLPIPYTLDLQDAFARRDCSDKGPKRMELREDDRSRFNSQNSRKILA